MFSRCSPACQIKPDRFAIVVVIGVQWGRFGLARLRVVCRRVVNFGTLRVTRVSGWCHGPGASASLSGTGLCSCVFSWAVAGVADRQRHAASRRSRGYRTERGLTVAGRHHCGLGCVLGHVGSQLAGVPGPTGPVQV
jgi:hypothetical protein